MSLGKWERTYAIELVLDSLVKHFEGIVNLAVFKKVCFDFREKGREREK